MKRNTDLTHRVCWGVHTCMYVSVCLCVSILCYVCVRAHFVTVLYVNTLVCDCVSVCTAMSVRVYLMVCPDGLGIHSDGDGPVDQKLSVDTSGLQNSFPGLNSLLPSPVMGQ